MLYRKIHGYIGKFIVIWEIDLYNWHSYKGISSVIQVDSTYGLYSTMIYRSVIEEKNRFYRKCYTGRFRVIKETGKRFLYNC